MKYEYTPSDHIHFATRLRWNEQSDCLQWECAQGQNTLVVQTPLGVMAADVLEDVLAALGGIELGESYVPVMPGIFVRLFPARDLGRGCPINGRACVYTVFATHQLSSDTCQVFELGDDGLDKPWCVVAQDLVVSVRNERRKSGFGLFGGKEKSTGFYVIAFDWPASATYADGDVYYLANGERILLTKAALEGQQVYVRSTEPPEVCSRSEGIRIIVR